MNYNKKDIINYINNYTKITKKKINFILNIFFKKIIFYLKKKINIKIKKLGKFIIKNKKNIKWKNPITKKYFIIPKKKIIKFNPSWVIKKNIQNNII